MDKLKLPEPSYQTIKSYPELDLYYSRLSHSIKFQNFHISKKSQLGIKTKVLSSSHNDC